MQLREYYDEGSPDSNPACPPASPSKKDRIDAMGLLNLNRFSNQTQRLDRTLEEEVDEYMLDSQIGTGILNFWQVYCLPSFATFAAHIMSYLRRISYDIRQSFDLPWT